MLVLTRRNGESIRLGDDVIIHVVEVRPGYVRIGVEAPRSVRVLRSELVVETAGENHTAAEAAELDHDDDATIPRLVPTPVEHPRAGRTRPSS